MLEVVKHFFSVPGVVCVLALDREQLGHSIKAMYGAHMDVGGYLRRFFDLEFNLPAGNGVTFVLALLEKFGLAEAILAESRNRGYDGPNSTPILISGLFHALSCSPRDQEKCFTHYALIKVASRRTRPWTFIGLFMVIILRVKRPDLDLGLLHGTKTIDDVIGDLGQSKRFGGYMVTRGGAYFEWYFRALTYAGSDHSFRSEMDAGRTNPPSSEGAQVLDILRSGGDGNLQLPPLRSLHELDAAINEMVQFNMVEFAMRWEGLINSNRPLKVLGIFILGLYVGRKMIYANLGEFLPLLKKVQRCGFLIGLPFSVLYAYFEMMKPMIPHPLGLINTASYAFSVVPLSLAYTATIWIWCNKNAQNKFLQLFAAPGQMALTNYLLQSIIAIVIFYGIGFGYGATTGLAYVLLIAIGVYITQMIYSHYWLRFFNYGPFEWLWRMLTYGKILKLRK